jgi:hypothetical protein
MNYDSEEEKNRQQQFSENLRLTKEFLSDKEKVNQLIDAFHKILELIQPLSEKIKAGEELSEDELQIFLYARRTINEARERFEDMESLLAHNRFIQADAIFFHFKKLADQGNEEAKKAYEQLLPSYHSAHQMDFDLPEPLN